MAKAKLHFSPFSIACLGWSPFGLSSLHSSVLFASGVLCVFFLLVGSFSVVLCLVRGCFLPGHFVFFLIRVAFALFGSSLLSFRGSCLRSLLPFSSRFLCCSLCLLLSVGVLSLPSLAVPPLSCPVSGSVSFGLWLLLTWAFLPWLGR